MFQSFTKVMRYTVRCCFSFSALRERRNRSQKSWKSGLSIALSESRVEASTETYSCVTGCSEVISSANWAFVTRKVLMCRLCSSAIISLMRGYIIGSPVQLNRKKLLLIRIAKCHSKNPIPSCQCVYMISYYIISYHTQQSSHRQGIMHNAAR